MASTTERIIKDVKETSATTANAVTFKQEVLKQQAVVDKLAGELVLGAEAQLIKVGEHFPADVTSPGGEALVLALTKSLLTAALKGGVELSVFEGLFSPGTNELEAAEPISLEDFSAQVSDIDYGQRIQELSAERMEA
jgi:hypothetical protein